MNRSCDPQLDDPEALYSLGISAHEQGRHDVAVKHLIRAIDISPRNPLYHNTIGKAYHALGKFGVASDHFRRALALDPGFGDAENNLRTTLEAWGRLDELGKVKASTIGSLERTLEDTGPSSWYVGRKVNIFPDKTEDFKDLVQLVEKYVIKGWAPDKKPFAKDSKLLTLGSCFATRLREYLGERSKWMDNIWVPSGFNNTFALRQFIEWCLTGSQSSDAYWYDEHERGGAIKWTPKDEQENYKRAFLEADGFVFTFGLAEVWSDKETGGVFWRGVPQKMFDAERHEYRLTTVEENEENILRTIDLIKQNCGDKPIILTLSPVPLKATFKNVSCMTADCVSKSILRVAIDNVTAKKIAGVYYWPSFEIVKWVGCHTDDPAFGMDDGISRHVSRKMVSVILDGFIKHFYEE